MFNTRVILTQKDLKKINLLTTQHFIFLGSNPQIQTYCTPSLDIFFTGKTYKWLYKQHT